MKLICTTLAFFVSILLSMPASAQSDGDYRTIASGDWSSVGIWERYDAMIIDWLPAGTAPTSADGVITIQNGHNVTLTSTMTIDQVVVAATGSLTINSGGTITVTLNNGAGDDLVVNGQLSLTGGTNTALSGAGTVKINSGGTFTFGGLAKLGAPLTNDGHIVFGTAGGGCFIQGGVTLTNNNTAEWVTAPTGHIVLLGGSSIVNNGTMTITSTLTPLNIYSNNPNLLLNQFTNTGTLIKNTSGTLDIKSNLNNSGTIAGTGTILLTGTTIANSGTIAPGLSPGTLQVPSTLFGANTSNVEIEITGAGTVAGTDYDQLTVSGNTDLANATLTIIDDNSTSPVGTVYTVMTTTGNFSGTPALVSSNFGNLTVNPTTVTIEKLAILPVEWGNDFTPLAKGNKVQLSWSTLQEVNTASFVIEHSTDGSHFAGIGQLSARGNSGITSQYSFLHNTPDLNKTNFYRIRQVDLDGKATYSVTRSVKFTLGKASAVTSFPNPVRDAIILTIQEKNLTITLNNINGVEVRRWRLEPGAYPLNLQELSPGIYQLNVYDRNRRIDGQKIIKL